MSGYATRGTLGFQAQLRPLVTCYVVLPVEYVVRSERILSMKVQCNRSEWEEANSEAMEDVLNMLEELRLEASLRKVETKR